MTDEEKKYEKEQWKKMSFSKKLQHFTAYYLWQTVAVCAGVAFLVYFTWNYFRPRETYALSVAVFDDDIDADAEAAMEEELRGTLGIDDPRARIVFRGNCNWDYYQDVQLIHVLTAAGEIDVMVAGPETFRNLAGTGFFTNLQEIMTDAELEKLGDRVIETAGWREMEEEQPGGSGVGLGEALPYGISLAGSEKWAGLSIRGTDDVIAGIVANSANIDNAKLFIGTMLPMED